MELKQAVDDLVAAAERMRRNAIAILKETNRVTGRAPSDDAEMSTICVPCFFPGCEATSRRGWLYCEEHLHQGAEESGKVKL